MPVSDGSLAAGQGCAETDARSAWQALGYRPSKLVAAWTNLTVATGAAFPGKLVAMAILDRNGFPPIDESGDTGPAGVMSAEAVRDRLVSVGLKLLPGRFAVQWNGLQPGKISNAVRAAGRNGTIIGWQSNEHAGVAGADCPTGLTMDTTCTSSSYAALLREGIANGGQFIEVWPADVTKFSGEIAAAGHEMKGFVK